MLTLALESWVSKIVALHGPFNKVRFSSIYVSNLLRMSSLYPFVKLLFYATCDNNVQSNVGVLLSLFPYHGVLGIHVSFQLTDCFQLSYNGLVIHMCTYIHFHVYFSSHPPTCVSPHWFETQWFHFATISPTKVFSLIVDGLFFQIKSFSVK
jgi:hypothetical protein